jgi:hypothetical protein
MKAANVAIPQNIVGAIFRTGFSQKSYFVDIQSLCLLEEFLCEK